jgi:type II secretory pathway pseudopilin PulG
MRLAMRSGASFLELVTVLTMMGVILAIAAPRMRVVPRQADAAAIQLTLALEEAQRTALAKQQQVLALLDSGGGRVRLIEDRDGDGGLTAGERARWIPLGEQVRFEDPPVRVDGTAATGAIVGTGFDTVTALPAIHFRRDGSASVAAEFYLTVTGKTVEHRAVVLPRATAHAEWYRYGDGAWKRGAP